MIEVATPATGRRVVNDCCLSLSSRVLKFLFSGNKV